MRNGWRPTRELLYAAVTVTVLLFGGVALHRPDLVVLGAPLATGLAFGLARIPGAPVRVALRTSAPTAFEGQKLDLVLDVDVPPEADIVVSSLQVGEWLADIVPEVRAMTPSEPSRTETTGVLRWGRSTAGRARVVVSGADGYVRCDADVSGSRVTLLPFRDRFDAVDVLPHASGTIGAHRSRRPGSGSELDTIRPFAAGDRLKRINWSVSLRTGSLHVASTLSERDTTVLLVLDSSIDVTPEREPAPGGSLDIAVHAAASIAEHYLRCGDRVGFVDHARVRHPIRPTAGRAHLDRIVDALLDVRAEPTDVGVALSNVARRLAPRSTVMLLSPLLGAASPQRAVELAMAGCTVLVVDTVGDIVPASSDSPWNVPAWRLMLLERRAELARLAALGVPVVPWRGEGSLDQVLLALSRAASAPRIR